MENPVELFLEVIAYIIVHRLTSKLSANEQKILYNNKYEILKFSGNMNCRISNISLKNVDK